MKRLIGVILCFSVLMIACNKNKKETTQTYSSRTMYVNVKEGIRVRDAPYLNRQEYSWILYLAEVTVIKEDNDIVNIGGVDGKFVCIISPMNGWVFDGFLSTYDNIENQIKEELIGNWIFYSFYCTLYSNGEFKGALLETSSSASGYWELKDNKVIINITKRMEDYREWNVNEKEEYKYSFTFGGLTLIPVNSDGEKNDFLSFLPKLSMKNKNNSTVIMIFNKFGEGKDIFGNYQLYADYVWEESYEYFRRFPKEMYVNATDGLWVRVSPSTDGEKLGSLKHNTQVMIIKEDINTENIGGIDGKWVYIIEPIEGWVFNGFLDNYTNDF
jgi:hypothetical protein